MSLRAAQRRRHAEALLAAATSRVAIAPLTEEHADLSLADAYRIQRELLRLRRHGGDRRVGWTVGGASAATRAALRLDGPVGGHVVASGVVADGAALSCDRFLAPGVQPVIAVLLGRDLAGPRATALDALRAVEAAAPALEIVDARVRDWSGTTADVAADNAFHAGVAIGGRLESILGLDLRLEGVVLERDGRTVASAAGAAALGHPLAATAWLANHLAGLGATLRAGDVVLTGGLTAIERVGPGTRLRAAFTRLGAVSLLVA